MTEPEQLKKNALEGSRLPVRRELYEDQEILDSVPVARLGKDVIIQNSRPRPVSPRLLGHLPGDGGEVQRLHLGRDVPGRGRLVSPGGDDEPRQTRRAGRKLGGSLREPS